MVHTKKISKNNSYHKKNELHANLNQKKKKTPYQSFVHISRKHHQCIHTANILLSFSNSKVSKSELHVPLKNL